MTQIKNPLIVAGGGSAVGKRQVDLASVVTGLDGSYFSSAGYFTLSVQQLAPQVVDVGNEKLMVVSPGPQNPAKLIPYALNEDGSYTLDTTLASVNLGNGETPYSGALRRSNLIKMSDSLVVFQFYRHSGISYFIPVTISGTNMAVGTAIGISDGDGSGVDAVRLSDTSLLMVTPLGWDVVQITNGNAGRVKNGTYTANSSMVVSPTADARRFVIAGANRVALCEVTENNELVQLSSVEPPAGFVDVPKIIGRCGDGVKLVRATGKLIKHCSIKIVGETLVVGEVVNDKSCVYTSPSGYISTTYSAGEVLGRAHEAIYNDDGSAMFVINCFAGTRTSTSKFGQQGSAILAGFNPSGALDFCQPVGANSWLGVSFSGYCPTLMDGNIALVSTNVGNDSTAAEFGPPVPGVVGLGIVGFE